MPLPATQEVRGLNSTICVFHLYGVAGGLMNYDKWLVQVKVSQVSQVVGSSVTPGRHGGRRVPISRKSRKSDR